MKITATLDYAATTQDVFAMLTDEAFQTRKCVATGALSYTVSITAEGERTVIVSNRVLPSDNLPSFVRGVVGPTTSVTETQDWGPVGPDGTREAELTVDIGGAPVALHGSLSLAPAGEGSVYTVLGDLKARVPLIGGKIESASAPAIQSAIRVEHETGQAWLASLLS